MMRIRRVKWKVPPPPELVIAVKFRCFFEMALYTRGDEWLFCYPTKDEPSIVPSCPPDEGWHLDDPRVWATP